MTGGLSAMLHSVDEANRLIMAGKRLHIAGDAAALARLGRGDWIGGTIPYFLTAEGGQADHAVGLDQVR